MVAAADTVDIHERNTFYECERERNGKVNAIDREKET